MAYQNPDCKKKLEDRKSGNPGYRNKNHDVYSTDEYENSIKKSVRTGLSWGDDDRVTRSGVTLMTNNSVKVNKDDYDVIVHGGATSTVIGWKLYLELCYRLDIEAEVFHCEENDPKYHGFGTERNSSSLQKSNGNAIYLCP